MSSVAVVSVWKWVSTSSSLGTSLYPSSSKFKALISSFSSSTSFDDDSAPVFDFAFFDNGSSDVSTAYVSSISHIVLLPLAFSKATWSIL